MYRTDTGYRSLDFRSTSPVLRSYSQERRPSEVSPKTVPRKSWRWRQAQAIKAQRRGQRKCLLIACCVVVGFMLTGLAVSVSLQFTIGKRRAQVSPLTISNVYIPPVIAHTTPENDLLIQMFEWNIPKNSKHWMTIESQLQNLKILGVKNIWIPPATKNTNRFAIGYDVYDLWDLGEFDAQGNVSTNMGTKAELTSLATEASSVGIGIIFDAVLNQRSGAEATISCTAYTVNDTNRLQATSDTEPIEAWLKFDYPARNGKYSDKTWGCDDFTAVDYDQITGNQSIFKLVGSNNEFETDVSSENGNYDYLMLADVAYKNPSVRADVLKWVQWINGQLPLDGFRLDAAKHLSTSFTLEVMDTIRDGNNGVDKFFAADYFTDDLSAITDYIAAFDGRIKVFDSLLLANLYQFSNSTTKDLRQIFNNTLVSKEPKSAVTFVASHDTQPGQALSEFYIAGWFLPTAYAIILLRSSGTPCLFYGDIYGVYDETVTYFTPNPKHQIIANIAVARKYWAYGTQTDYFNSKSVIGWTYTGVPGDRPDGLAALISNAFTEKTLVMNVGSQHVGETWTDITRNIIAKSVVIDADGNGEFPVRGESVSVWVNADAAEGRGSLNRFDGDIYGLMPYDIGYATNTFVPGAGVG